jgi:type I restriction enzyme, S subunit
MKVEKMRADYAVITRVDNGAGRVPFSEVTESKVDQGGPLTSNEFIYIDISSVDNKLKRITEYKTLATHDAPSRAKQRLKAGDVLVSMTRPNLNAVAIVPPELDGAVGSTGFHILRAREGTEPLWLYYAVQTHGFISAMSELVQGALYPAVRPKDIRAFEILRPPLELQKRIVAEIEKQFSRLDEAVANLKRVKANLKRYKAAVLKAAVEGRLVETEAEFARREGRKYETGAQLLQRILEACRGQWKGKGKYKDPAAPDTTDLPELPEGWVWSTVEAICEKIVDCPHSTAPFANEGYPCIDTTWMTMEGLVIERARFVNLTTYQERIARLEPKVGDIVFAREGTIGTAVMIPERMKPCLGQRVMLLRLSTYFSNKLLMHTLHSEVVKSQYRAQALGSTVPHINVGDVKRFSIPVPPFVEQQRIVAEVDRCLTIVHEVGAEVDANLKRSERLRQSVLSSSFQAG